MPFKLSSGYVVKYLIGNLQACLHPNPLPQPTSPFSTILKI